MPVAVAGGQTVRVGIVGVEEEVVGAISPHVLPHSHASLRSCVCAFEEDPRDENYWKELLVGHG
jgi:hypothetical protein